MQIDILYDLAEKVLKLEDINVCDLLPEVQERMECPDGSPEWEQSVVVFFILNGLRVKDNLACQEERRQELKTTCTSRHLRLVK